MLDPAGVELEFASLRQSLALIWLALRSSAQPEGVGLGYQNPPGRDPACWQTFAVGNIASVNSRFEGFRQALN